MSFWLKDICSQVKSRVTNNLITRTKKDGNTKIGKNEAQFNRNCRSIRRITDKTYSMIGLNKTGVERLLEHNAVICEQTRELKRSKSVTFKCFLYQKKLQIWPKIFWANLWNWTSKNFKFINLNHWKCQLIYQNTTLIHISSLYLSLSLRLAIHKKRSFLQTIFRFISKTWKQKTLYRKSSIKLSKRAIRGKTTTRGFRIRSWWITRHHPWTGYGFKSKGLFCWEGKRVRRDWTQEWSSEYCFG